jgi:hypothetical protein
VTFSNFCVSSSALGSCTRNPIGSVTVSVAAAFVTLMPYPFLPDGGWTLHADSTYSLVRGR